MKGLKLRCIMLLVGGGALLAGSAMAGSIVGTKHDMSSTGGSSAFGSGTTQICIYCHAPHNAKVGADQIVPLWNHGTTTATYTLYASASLNAVPGQPSSNSKACLSCHDGTVAIDTYGTNAGTHSLTSANTTFLDTNLSNDHPISFTYDGTLATNDGGLVSPSSTSLVVTGIPLFSGRLECASCHNVHDNDHTMFLRSANAGSALCLKCHVK